MNPAPRFAINARSLLETRQRGLRPEGVVNVALVSGGGFNGLALYVHPDMPVDLDWRMLVNLDVWLWADLGVPLDRVVDAASCIARVKPASLLLRFENGERIHDLEIGIGTHFAGVPEHSIPPVHSFLWLPVNLTGSLLGLRLKQALCASPNAQDMRWN